MFEQVCVQELEYEALVFSKVDVLVHSHNVVFVLFIFLHQEFQKFCLLLCKLMVNLCVSVNLNCYIVSSLMVLAADYLSKASFS